MQLDVSLPESFSKELQEAVTKTVGEAITQIEKGSNYPAWMDKGTAAKYLGVSRVTFDKILRKYDVPYTVLNASYFFSKDELNKFMLENSK